MTILKTSLEASILIIVIMIARQLVINKIPKTTFLILWGIVVIKLVFPFSFFSEITARLHLFDQSVVGSFPLVEKSVQPLVENQFIYQSISQLISHPIIPFLRVLGTVMIALFFIIAYIKSYKKFQTAIPITNNSYITEWVSTNKLRRPVRISISDQTTTPLTYKLFKPVILLPKSENWLDEDKVLYVLTHEMIHIKRMDIFWKILLASVLAIHWFNPLVWLMYYTVNQDIEISCDELVIKHLGIEKKADYASSLISLAEKRVNHHYFCPHFSTNGIEERIVSIMKMKKTSMFGIVLASLLVIGSLAIFALTGHAATVINGGSAIEQTTPSVVESASSSTKEAVIISDDTTHTISNEEPVVLHP